MTETLYEGKFLKVVKRNNWEYVTRYSSDVVVILPVIHIIDSIILIEEYREPLEKIVVGLPAGLVGDKPGQEKEDIFGAARRELEEETGWLCNNLKLVASDLPSSPGLSDETFNLFIARDLIRTGAGGGDETENISVKTISLNKLNRYISTCKEFGYAIDPKIYMALYFLEF